MSLFLDKQYVALLSPKLELFSQKSEYLWKFRCPICGDSKKHKTKTRGYVYRKGTRDALSFQCHNCGDQSTFKKFIERVDPALYQQYKFEDYTGVTKSNDFDTNLKIESVPEKKQSLNTITLPKIVDLPLDHYARQYLEKRQIPSQFLSDLYFASDYKLFVNEMLPNNHYKIVDNDARIVIPFYDKNKNLVGVQGRAVLPSAIKYITVKFQEDAPKVWGLDRLDFGKKIYVLEGPIDAMFLDNAVATMDGSLHRIVSLIGDHDYTLVFDNEPRNRDIVHHMEDAVKYGQSVCVWPSNVTGKDVNEMILAGHSGATIQAIIDKHTFSDVRATLEIHGWKKI